MSKAQGSFHIYLNQYDTQHPWTIALLLDDKGAVTEYRFKSITIQCPLESVDSYHVMPHKNRYKLLASNAVLTTEGDGNALLKSIYSGNIHLIKP